jgi:hypothetical protein
MTQRRAKMKNIRIAGWAAIGFVAVVVALNVVENVGTGRPDPGAAAEEVARWATDAAPYLWASTMLVPVAWVLLALVTVTMWEKARSAGQSMFSPMLAVLGSAMTMGTLSAAIAADAVLISSVEVLSADAVEVLSGVATALFLLNWAALAVTLFGLSRTVLELRLAPRWTDRVSIAGSGLLLVGSMQAAAALDGVLPGLLLGFAGFAIWLLFLLVTGIRLVRTDRTELTVTKAAA